MFKQMKDSQHKTPSKPPVKKPDYCTLFFDKIKDYDISGCCRMHDEEYEDPNVDRKKADNDLKECVNKVTNSNIGDAMFIGVRVFGWIFWYKYRLGQVIKTINKVGKEQCKKWL